MAVGPFDEAVESQSTEVVGHLPGAVGDAEQRGNEGAVFSMVVHRVFISSRTRARSILPLELRGNSSHTSMADGIM